MSSHSMPTTKNLLETSGEPLRTRDKNEWERKISDTAQGFQHKHKLISVQLGDTSRYPSVISDFLLTRVSPAFKTLVENTGFSEGRTGSIAVVFKDDSPQTWNFFLYWLLDSGLVETIAFAGNYDVEELNNAAMLEFLEEPRMLFNPGAIKENFARTSGGNPFRSFLVEHAVLTIGEGKAGCKDYAFLHDSEFWSIFLIAKGTPDLPWTQEDYDEDAHNYEIMHKRVLFGVARFLD